MDVNGFYATLSRPASARVGWTDSDQSAPSTAAASSLLCQNYKSFKSRRMRGRSLEILDSCVATNILNRSFRRMNHCS